MGIRAALAAVLLAASVASCGGDDKPPAAPPADTTESANPSDANADESDGAPSTGPTVLVDLGGTTYEFSDGGCTVTGDSNVVSQYFDGADALNLTSSEGVLLIRATLDGELWGYTGESSEVDADDPANVTWSGELTKSETQEPPVAATITVHC
jgi:hypothetical protein